MKLLDPITGRVVWDGDDPYAGPVPPAPEGRQWVATNTHYTPAPQQSRGLDYYDGGTGILNRLAILNQTFNPIEAIGQSMDAGSRVFSPGRSGWDRVADTGNMLSGVAGVVAPAAASSRIGAPAVNALVESMTGLSMTPQANALAGFAADESGALNIGPLSGLTAEQAQASDIMDLLRSGRGAEVTDEMMAGADQEFLSSIYDLPMDQASRLSRARGMYEDAARRAVSEEFAAQYGLRTDTKPDGWTRPSRVWSEGRVTKRKLPGVSATSLRSHNNDAAFAAHGLGGKIPYSMEDYSNLGGDRDFLSLIYGDTAEPGEDFMEIVIPDAQSALTRNRKVARFDPRLAHLRNLSAGFAGLGLMGAAQFYDPYDGGM